MFRRIIGFIFLVLIATLAQAGEAGRIVFATGEAQVGGVPAVLNLPVQEGDELATGANGYLYLKTVDNGFLILRPASRARVAAYHVDQQNSAGSRIKLELLNGVARHISGQAVQQAKQNFRFNTPVAAIGVRGTDFTVFADQESTRIVVASGGVVVSGFGGSCAPAGAGPCEGGASRELFARQADQLLQVRRGQSVPELLRASAGLSPDSVAPPRTDEPAGKANGQSRTNGDVARYELSVSLDQKKSDGLKVVTPAPVSAPVQPEIKAQIVWGRWEALSNLAPDSAILAQIRNGEFGPAKIVGSYVISRLDNSDLVLPRDGRAAFSLTASEAYLLGAAGQAATPANIENSRLEVDFAKRSFVTSLDVVGPGARVAVNAQGDITAKGEMVSDIIYSNARVGGYLAGAKANEAAYIFNRVVSPELSAVGATRWAR